MASKRVWWAVAVTVLGVAGARGENGPTTREVREVVLFDGKGLDEWEMERYVGEPNWVVKEGVLRAQAVGDDIRSRREFDDFELHVP